jgi:plasmid stability protein
MSSATKPKTTSLLIRHLDPALHDRLKARARANHRSLQEEVREALRRDAAREAIPEKQETLLDIAERIFGKHGGVELDLPPRGSDIERPPVDFSGPDYDP